MTSTVERIYHHAQKTPDKVAVVFEGSAATYGELWDMSVRCAHLLRGMDVSEGDRVVCQCRYDPLFVAIRFAAHLCGAAFVPADRDAGPDKLADLAGQLGARLIVANGRDETLPANRVSYEELRGMLPEDISIDGLSFPGPDVVSEVLFTTGTTGASKGVLLTQRNMVLRALSYIREYDPSTDEVGITMVPLNHFGAIVTMDAYFVCGYTVIFLDGMMKVGLLFDCMDRYGVTAVFLPPAGVALIERLSQNRLADYADQLEKFYLGTAAMPKPQLEYLRRMLPDSRLYCSYASSESGLISALRLDEGDRGSTCCGKPVFGVNLRVVDEGFRPVPTGCIGLIAVKSEMVMSGYYDRPDLNDEVFHEGYFVSSDVGYLDDEGCLYVLGRSDDMVNIGGLKVLPSEVESAALRIPGIEECVCFGVPDPVTGQAVKLLVRAGDGFSGSVAQVREALSWAMDYYKVPKSIEIVGEIAKTANGKPDRKRYQQMDGE